MSILIIGLELGPGGLRTELRIASDEMIDAICYRPRPTPIAVAMEAARAARVAYEEAINAKHTLEELEGHIPLDRGDLYQQVRKAEDFATDAVGTAADTKTAIETLLYRLQQEGRSSG